MAKKPLSLRIDEDLLRRVDEARGDVPRTRFVERALEAAVTDHEAGWIRDPHGQVIGQKPPAKKTAIALEVREAVAEHRKDKPIAFDQQSAAMERQRTMNKAKGL